MPRYIGLVWPAFAIAVAALLLRLPGRPLRWATIALLLGVNCAQATARIVAGTEPPYDRIARDVVDAQAGDMRTYTDLANDGRGHPGTLSLNTYPLKYYLAMDLGQLWWQPRRLWMADPRQLGVNLWPTADDATIARDAAANPRWRRIVVWQSCWSEPVDALSARLGPPWRLGSVEYYAVRQHWLWLKWPPCWRREYVRP
jgi:hypothetical protein